ncbi:hypothetical protein vBAbaPP1_29 [Acinetobacter phage vB_AbaM_P1]|nr:hypothetical protein vBAbaPP1_29 [Acinetobacter phage vB_AbaM_P1]
MAESLENLIPISATNVHSKPVLKKTTFHQNCYSENLSKRLNERANAISSIYTHCLCAD